MAEDAEGGRKLRIKERKKYIDQEIDEDDIDGRRTYSVEEKLVSDKFTADMVQELKGPEFTLEWMQRNGLTRPIVFYDKAGLGLRVPSENFKVSDVKQCVGSRRILDVMDVTTQKAMEMSMKDWVRYYENPERDRLLNVISLEFCHTRLENYVESPTLVRQIDWVDRAWPRHLKECQTESTNVIEKMKYPKVQKYCLMSVAGCYTDFHIDFGGTSVWYHILHGEKIFWLAPPSQKNLDKYVEWTLSAKQGDTFLGDVLEQCQRITLYAGYTFIIPSGWIHAVYTPKDSLVFGGNFLHSFNIENQLLVARIEDKTYVPSKFRYPFFTEIMWYVVDRYICCLTGHTYLTSCEKDEVDEDDQGLIQVDEDSRPPSRNPDSRPPSRAMDDSMDTTKIKSESGEDTPKLSKSVTIELTRIDAALRRSQSEEENQPPHARPRVPRKAVSDPNSAWEGGGGPRKWIHLTATELEGLKHLVDYLCGLMTLPPSKRGVPKEMLDPEAVLREIKQVLEDHKNDDQELAVTGEPSIGWPESARKKQQKLKLGYKTFKTAKTAKGSTSSSSVRRRRTRCKQCEACTRTECGECTYCKDMKKFGGPGRMKQTCISRQCMAPILPSSSVCMICNQEGQPNAEDPNDISSSLMECGICWEIVHPSCLQKKYENLDNEGVINEDLPNSWECSKCCNEGKQGQLKPRIRPGTSSKKIKAEDHRFSADSDGSQEEESLSPISPVEGKRVVSKEGSSARNGEGTFIKAETGKWSSPSKKLTTFSDAKVKTEDGMPLSSMILSSFSSTPSQSPSREENPRKRGQAPSSQPTSGHKDQKKQIKKEKTSAPNSPSPPQQDESPRNSRKRPSAVPGSSGDKTNLAPAADSLSKRPKRENGRNGASVSSDMKSAKSVSESAKVDFTRSTSRCGAALTSNRTAPSSTCSVSALSNKVTGTSLSRSSRATKGKMRSKTEPTDHEVAKTVKVEDVIETDSSLYLSDSKAQFRDLSDDPSSSSSSSNVTTSISAASTCDDNRNTMEVSTLSMSSPSSSSSSQELMSSTTAVASTADHIMYHKNSSSSSSPQSQQLALNMPTSSASFTFKKPLPGIHCARVIYIKANPLPCVASAMSTASAPTTLGLKPTVNCTSNAQSHSKSLPIPSTSPMNINLCLTKSLTVSDVYHPIMCDHPYCNMSTFVHT